MYLLLPRCRVDCGDGVIDPGETCDPGQFLSGDCCTGGAAGCLLVPAGTTCSTGTGDLDQVCDIDGICVGKFTRTPFPASCDDALSTLWLRVTVIV